MDAEFLGWPPCDVCGERVDPRDGLLSIDQVAAGARLRGRQRWAAEHAEGFEGARLFSPGALTASPEPIPWWWTHNRCMPAPNTYGIAGTRFDSMSMAMAWTFHIMEKVWFDPRAWESAIRRFWRLPSA